jgi:hypothetical protein
MLITIKYAFFDNAIIKAQIEMKKYTLTLYSAPFMSD